MLISIWGYLEIPLMVGYRIPLMEKVHLVPSIGTYFACGVVGSGDLDIIVSDESGSTRPAETWDNPFKDFKRRICRYGNQSILIVLTRTAFWTVW